MTKMVLALLFLISYNRALADENMAVNFHQDQRVGQFDVKIKLTSSGDIIQFSQKICFVTAGARDQRVEDKLELGCRAKKIKDTDSELEYLVICSGKTDAQMLWRRISENEFSFSLKSSYSEIESTYKYNGSVCDSDAVKK